MKKCVYLDDNKDLTAADFYGIYQYSDIYPPSPYVGGHQGGVRAWPIALVCGEDGIVEVNPLSIKKIYEVEE